MPLLSRFLLPCGSVAPDFALEDVNGVRTDLDALLAGRRALLLDFFFLACGPMPADLR